MSKMFLENSKNFLDLFKKILELSKKILEKSKNFLEMSKKFLENSKNFLELMSSPGSILPWLRYYNREPTSKKRRKLFSSIIIMNSYISMDWSLFSYPVQSKRHISHINWLISLLAQLVSPCFLFASSVINFLPSNRTPAHLARHCHYGSNQVMTTGLRRFF